MELKTISASSLNLYENCPACWKLQYVTKLIQPMSDALFIGICYHDGTELFHKGRNEEAVFSILKEKMLKEKDAKSIDNFGLVRKMLEAYFRNPINDETINTEWWFEIPAKDIPVKIIGKIDRVTTEGVVEYKTSSKDYTDKDLKESVQNLFYSYAYLKEHGKMPLIKYSVNNKKKCKRKDYEPQLLTITRAEKDLEDLHTRCKTMYERVLENNFNVITGKSCKFCNFIDHCEHCRKLRWK